MKRAKRKRSALKFDRVETVLFMEGLSSREYFYAEGQKPRRVLKDINLTFRRPEAWAVYGRSFYEIKLLLEIMANIKPYHDGKCVLVERGMMRNKRVILEHVFYIGAPTMLYDNMNVLEYLMFATARKGFSPVYRQAQLFELLIDTGLGHISLTAVSYTHLDVYKRQGLCCGHTLARRRRERFRLCRRELRQHHQGQRFSPAAAFRYSRPRTAERYPCAL